MHFLAMRSEDVKYDWNKFSLPNNMRISGQLRICAVITSDSTSMQCTWAVWGFRACESDISRECYRVFLRESGEATHVPFSGQCTGHMCHVHFEEHRTTGKGAPKWRTMCRVPMKWTRDTEVLCQIKTANQTPENHHYGTSTTHKG